MASSTAIYTAIRSKLIAASAITALVSTRVVSLFSKGTSAYPFLCFGFISEAPPGDSGMRTQRWQFTACAGALGMAAAQDIIEAVIATLDMKSLTVTGWTVYEMRLISTRTDSGDPGGEYVWAHADFYLTLKPA